MKYAEFDVIEDVFETLRFRGSIFFNSPLAPPWGIQLEEVDAPRFHIAFKGNCVIGADDSETTHLCEMDIALLPNGCGHWIADQEGRELVSCERAEEACEFQSQLFQNGETTHHLICGLGRFDGDASSPIFDTLPSVLHFSNLKEEDPVRQTALLISAELSRNNDKGGSVVDRLAEALFMQLLSRYFESSKEQLSFPAALRDRRVQHALQLIHQNPSHNWTLELLGDRVGMSRATLARHFRETLGTSVTNYINEWRLQKARKLIKHSNLKIDEIAVKVGYASAQTLNKAFKRQFGLTPRKLRVTN